MTPFGKTKSQLLALLNVTVRTFETVESSLAVHAAAFAGDSLSVKLTARVVAIKKIATNNREATDTPRASDLRMSSAKKLPLNE